MTKSGPLEPWLTVTAEARNEDQGRKLRGLAGLPASWIPPYAGASSELVSLLSQDPHADPLSGSHAGEKTLKSIAGTAGWVILRSDGLDEHRRPGEATTTLVRPSWAEILPAMRRQICDVGPDCRPMIQRLVTPALLGAASNERRFGPRKDTWTLEGWLDRGRLTVRRVRAQGRPGARVKLHASTPDDLIRVLRLVCWTLSLRDERVRCEWAWDGRRLWVLQADSQEPVYSDPEFVAALTGRRSLPATAGPPADVSPSPKVQSLRDFARLGWPTLPTTVVDCQDHVDPRHDSSIRRIVDDLVSDMDGRALVVRTDLRVPLAQPVVLLPTSPPLTSAEQVMGFMSAAWESLTEADTLPEHIRFLIAPLVATAASAMAYGVPGRHDVPVHAVWGYPDGLLTLPHDSYSVRNTLVRTGKIERQIAYKPAALMLLRRGRRHVDVGPPWDWQRVLRDDEVRVIANWARELSTALDTALQLMVLVRIDGRTGLEGCLPFHYTRVDATLDGPIASTSDPRAEVSDLATLRAATESVEQGGAVDLVPSAGLDRDAKFLTAVAKAAVDNSWVVRFSGSTLGHAYYVLRSHGALVSQPSVDGGKARRAVVVLEADGVYRIRGAEQADITRAKSEPSAVELPEAFADLPIVSSARRSTPVQPGEVSSFMTL